MTVVKVEEEAVKADENPALARDNNPGLDGEPEAGYVSPDDEDLDDEEEETDSDGDGDYENPTGAPQLKKGPWTPEEDKRLKDYVEAHGEGNWNKLQRSAGLNRCGKSCRLRWANHLRPDLKKGPFDAEEVEKILRFHIMWGNKWAKMASHEGPSLLHATCPPMPWQASRCPAGARTWLSKADWVCDWTSGWRKMGFKDSVKVQRDHVRKRNYFIVYVCGPC